MILFRRLYRYARHTIQSSIKRRIVFLIVGFVTVTPTVLIALLASTYYYLGIESLFNEKISNALSETVKIAELYLEEHNSTIKSDILGVAKDIERNSALLSENPKNFDDLWMKEAELRSISEAMVFTKNNEIVSKTFSSLSLFFAKIPPEVLESADNGEVIVLDNRDDDKVRAVVKLFGFEDTYLLIGKNVDQNILNHLTSSQGSQAQYQSLLREIGNTRIRLGMAFIILSITLCIISVYVAIRLAKKIAKPINQLVSATTYIKHGDFSIRVPEGKGNDETVILAKAFNQMTGHIEEKTKELKKVNKVLNERSRFIETVLKDISTGLIVIKTSGEIALCNQSAYILLEMEEGSLIGRDYKLVIDEITDLIEKSAINSGMIISDNITFRTNNKELHLFVRVNADVGENGGANRYIVTIDDMTTLVQAQKAAAWGEVARRIAHEIKNPLTPITLAAERLLSKFSKQITEDKTLFEKYVNTITNHVEDIGNIVEEFVEFAKKDKINKSNIDVLKIIQEVKFSHESISPNVSIFLIDKSQNAIIFGDKTKISQLFVNLIKNSIEAIDARINNDPNFSIGKIEIKLSSNSDSISISIKDNGVGIPKEMIKKIHDPYVTTKKNGTGLGLSIVKKIVEDHMGLIQIKNNKLSGVEVLISLPLSNS
jgi:two-component system nitrogen regulation sensor histidine kinase NtrY